MVLVGGRTVTNYLLVTQTQWVLNPYYCAGTSFVTLQQAATGKLISKCKSWASIKIILQKGEKHCIVNVQGLQHYRILHMCTVFKQKISAIFISIHDEICTWATLLSLCLISRSFC